jgi:hypothetical protein
MADTNKIAQMLETLVNGDQAAAEELFHEYVVEKSREIYEGLIENELDLEEGEGDEETDDLLSDVEGDMDGEEDGDMGDMDGEGDEDEDEGEGDEDEPATKGDIANLTDMVQQLEDELARMIDSESDDGMGDAGEFDQMGKEELEIEDLDSFDQGFEDLETVREYVEKVGAGHGAESKGAGETNVNAKSIVAGKNDMGGTTANILKGGEGSNAGTTGGLLNPSTKEDNAGNVNVSGSKTATKLSPVAKGHGAEKSGAKEDGGTNKTSLFRK